MNSIRECMTYFVYGAMMVGIPIGIGVGLAVCVIAATWGGL